jgi:ankyrin repeat protein
MAARSRNKTKARLLLEHRADVNAKDSNGSTALHMAAMFVNEMMAQLCTVRAQSGCQHEEQSWVYGTTYCGHVWERDDGAATARARVDVNAKDNNEWTALHMANSYAKKKEWAPYGRHKAIIQLFETRTEPA